MANDINKDIGIKIKGDTSDFNNKIKGAGDKAKEFGDKTKIAGDKAKSGLDKASQGADTAKIKLGVAAVAVQGFTSQIAGMGQQILDFNSKVIALQKTMVGLESQELALKRAQEDLNKAVEEGTISDRDFHRALEDIELQYKNVTLESKNVEAETTKLNGEFVSFGVQGVSAVTQVTIGLIALRGTSAWSGIVSSLRMVGGALWTIAKHPVFLIITAGILAWELGLKSIVENLTGIDDLGIFSNIQKAFDGLTEGENSMEELDRQTRSFGDTVEKGLPVYGSMAEKLDDVGESAEKTTKKVKGLTIAQEQLIRSGGFRAGGGTSLSKAIRDEADSIDYATARTLAAASLHNALKESGFSGSVFSSNISGELNANGFKPAKKKGGPLGGLGGLIEKMQAEGATVDIIAKSLAKGAGKQSGAIGGFRGLTKSGPLSSSVGAGQGKRRSGRDRNPLGRTDKFSVFKTRAANAVTKQNQDLFNLVGGFQGNGYMSRRFGKNSGLGGNEMRNILNREFEAHLADQVKKAEARFVDLKKTQGVNDIPMPPAQFAKLQVIPGSFKEIRGVIEFQKRLGHAVTGVTV